MKSQVLASGKAAGVAPASPPARLDFSESTPPGWLRGSALERYPAEVLIDPMGRMVELPSILVTQFCCRKDCRAITVRYRELDRPMKIALGPHLRAGLVRERSPLTAGPGPCICAPCGAEIRKRERNKR